jgi:hypothetical protein
MPERDAVRLIYATQEGALSTFLTTLQLKERRSPWGSARKHCYQLM